MFVDFDTLNCIKVHQSSHFHIGIVNNPPNLRKCVYLANKTSSTEGMTKTNTIKPSTSPAVGASILVKGF